MKRSLILTGTHFEVLGIAPEASPSEVEAAYLRALEIRRTCWGRLRIGVSRGCTEAALAEAHRVLADPDARSVYMAQLWRRQRCPLYLNPYL